MAKISLKYNNQQYDKTFSFLFISTIFLYLHSYSRNFQIIHIANLDKSHIQLELSRMIGMVLLN